MDETEKICQACGSEDVEITHPKHKVDVPFAEPVFYVTKATKCKSCGAEIRIGGPSQDQVEFEIFKSATKSIPKLLKKINEDGYSDSRIERILDLSKGTVELWKKGVNIGATEIALIRFIYLMPFLLKIAEEWYDPDKLKRIQDQLNEVLEADRSR